MTDDEREARRERDRARYWADPEAARAKRRAHHAKHKDARNAKRRKQRAASNSETRTKEWHSSYKWRYGITIEQRDAMLAAQGGRCAICRGTEHRGRDWCTDHDHACCPQKSRSCGDCVRGILCFPCNVALGCVRDDPQVLESAIAYLQKSMQQAA